jgi:hypothetical protein
MRVLLIFPLVRAASLQLKPNAKNSISELFNLICRGEVNPPNYSFSPRQNYLLNFLRPSKRAIPMPSPGVRLDVDYLEKDQRYLYDEANLRLTAGTFPCQDFLQTVKPAWMDYS